MKRLLILSLIIIAVVMPLQAQEAIDETDISAELNAQMDGLVRATEVLRGLETLNPVERAFPTRAETIDYLNDLYDAELPPEEMARSEAFYIALGLLPEDIDLREVYLTLLGSQIAGFYDTDTKVMNVIPTGSEAVIESLSLMEQIIFVHEYAHALQDQAFDLDAMLDAMGEADQPDASLALTALVEGDASAVMALYLQEVASRNPTAALQLLGESLSAGNLTMPPGTPSILTRELMFPYEQGQAFVQAIARAGDNWDAVNEAYLNPPTTTEQIIHPEKYLAGEGATEVTAPAITNALADEWSLLWDVTLGEYYLREHLYTRLSWVDASSAAAGWGGDQLQLVQHADGSLAWTLDLVWDTAEDADEFLAAYEQAMEARFGGGADQAGCWADDQSAVCLTIDQDGLITVYNAPTLELIAEIAAIR